MKKLLLSICLCLVLMSIIQGQSESPVEKRNKIEINILPLGLSVLKPDLINKKLDLAFSRKINEFPYWFRVGYIYKKETRNKIIEDILSEDNPKEFIYPNSSSHALYLGLEKNIIKSNGHEVSFGLDLYGVKLSINRREDLVNGIFDSVSMKYYFDPSNPTSSQEYNASGYSLGLSPSFTYSHNLGRGIYAFGNIRTNLEVVQKTTGNTVDLNTNQNYENDTFYFPSDFTINLRLGLQCKF